MEEVLRRFICQAALIRLMRTLKGEKRMARQGSFLSGPSIHNTQKIRKHVLKRELTRDLNAAAGTVVNSKNPGSIESFRYASAPKAIGPRFGKTANPPRAKFPTRRRRR